MQKGTIVAGMIGLGSIASTPASAATISVSGGGDALQTAINNASDGDTIVVTDSATYNPVVVDVGVTIKTEESPTIAGSGDQVVVSIAADNVTFSGFRVTNQDGLLGVKVENEIDNVSIANNTIENIGPTGSLGVTGVIVGQGDHDNIDIANNTIQNLDQETEADSGFPTVNGILFDADNSSPGTISNSNVKNNVIRDIESDVAPLGIVVQHKTDSVEINSNEIRNLTAADSTDSDPSDGVDIPFTFAQGINIDNPSAVDTEVVGNVIEDITSAEAILPEAVKIDGDGGGGVTFRRNDLLVAIGLNNQNGADDAPTVDARNNYWGSQEGPEEADSNSDADDDDRADVVGNVIYRPFLKESKS